MAGKYGPLVIAGALAVTPAAAENVPTFNVVRYYEPVGPNKDKLVPDKDNLTCGITMPYVSEKTEDSPPDVPISRVSARATSTAGQIYVTTTKKDGAYSSVLLDVNKNTATVIEPGKDDRDASAEERATAIRSSQRLVHTCHIDQDKWGFHAGKAWQPVAPGVQSQVTGLNIGLDAKDPKFPSGPGVMFVPNTFSAYHEMEEGLDKMAKKMPPAPPQRRAPAPGGAG